jgi:myo-inositol 2-dehydrogenase/D-chiro-inositol 1-dehydrogenase
VKEAAQAGKAIFCEKPIDTSLEAIDEALAVVRECNVPLMVGFNRRFDANYQRLRKAVQSGEIGNPHMFHIVSRDPSPPPIEYVKSSGGIWMDCAVHDFDMSRFLIGDDVEEVMAYGACNINKDFELYGDVDTSLVTLKFKNGVFGTIDNSRQAVYGYDQRAEVFGSKGSCHINNNYANTAILSTGNEIKRDLPMNFFMDRYSEAFVTEMQAFVDALVNKTPIPCTGLDGRAPVAIAFAAKKSFEENRPVKVSEVDVALPPVLQGWDGQPDWEKVSAFPKVEQEIVF